jgi:hypothetical protein
MPCVLHADQVDWEYCAKNFESIAANLRDATAATIDKGADSKQNAV